MNEPIWLDGAMERRAPLRGDVKTDVLVVGGGICGIMCAYFLKQAGTDCVVVEKDRIAGGVTAGTTAKITALHGLIYSELMEKKGFEAAELFYQANRQAVLEFGKLAREADCDFEELSAYTYSLQDKEKIEKEYAVLEMLGAPAELRYTTPLPFDVAAAVGLGEQAQFHPLKFLRHIAKDLQIYENTWVRKITPHCAVCDRGRIWARKIIIATHFPFIDRRGWYFLKLYQHRSYVLALEGAPGLDGMYVDEADKGLSFRNHGKLLLLGGGGGRTGKPCGGWEELQRVQAKYYPKSRIVRQWATQDCMTLDGLPLIGQYSPATPDLYVATGFQKWGMTSSMVAARVLCDAVGEVDNDCASLFAPNRSILHPQLAVNVFETLTNFLYPTVRRCPHLGCALKWNRQEHTWDCSCHGSRFAADGTLLNNPANRNKGKRR